MKVLGETGTNKIVESVKALRPKNTRDTETMADGVHIIGLVKSSENKFTVAATGQNFAAAIVVYVEKSNIYPISQINCTGGSINSIAQISSLKLYIEALKPIPSEPEEITSVAL